MDNGMYLLIIAALILYHSWFAQTMHRTIINRNAKIAWLNGKVAEQDAEINRACVMLSESSQSYSRLWAKHDALVRTCKERGMLFDMDDELDKPFTGSN